MGNKIVMETKEKLLNPSSVVKSDFGIELELELDQDFNLEDLIYKPDFFNYWSIDYEEFSLRNGCEFVSRSHNTNCFNLDNKNFQKAMKILGDSLKEHEWIKSNRCSTHIHTNVSYLTRNQIKNIIFCYYLLEDLLTSMAPKDRRGNLFCIRYSDMGKYPFLNYYPFTKFKNLSSTNFVTMYEGKYSALNLSNLSTLNTLEFRFMPAYLPNEFNSIIMWVKLFSQLKNSFKDKNVSSFIEEIEIYYPNQLLKNYFSLDVVNFILNNSEGDVSNLLRSNIYSIENDLEKIKHKRKTPVISNKFQYIDPIDEDFSDINFDNSNFNYGYEINGDV